MHDVTLFIKKRIQLVEKPACAILAIGCRKSPVTPTTASHLYRSVVLSKLMYGCEVMEIPNTALMQLESFHANKAKNFQALPEQTTNIGAVKAIGWTSMKVNIDVARLAFLWRILTLPVNCVYKSVLITRYVQLIYGDNKMCCGPLWQTLVTAQKYGLLDAVKEAIESGYYMCIMEWKKLVKFKVIEREARTWRIQGKIFSSLKTTYKSTAPYKMSSWWVFVHKNPIYMWKCVDILRLTLGVHKLNTVLFRYKNNTTDSPLCQLCELYECETVPHLLLRCLKFEDIRNVLWANVVSKCPSKSLLELLLLKNDEVVTQLLLTGFNNAYVPEWTEFFEAIAMFVSNIYKERLYVTNGTNDK